MTKLLSLLLLLPVAALAQPTNLKSDEPIEITSDALEVFQEENRAVFMGNVVAIQADMRLKADKMTVFYATGGQDNAAQEGAIKKIVVVGNVFLSTPDETASGKRGLYDVVNKKIYLNDDVVLTRQTNTLKGTELVYDMNTSKSVIKSTGVVQGKKGDRVRALFVPNKKDGK